LVQFFSSKVPITLGVAKNLTSNNGMQLNYGTCDNSFLFRIAVMDMLNSLPGSANGSTWTTHRLHLLKKTDLKFSMSGSCNIFGYSVVMMSLHELCCTGRSPECRIIVCTRRCSFLALIIHFLAYRLFVNHECSLLMRMSWLSERQAARLCNVGLGIELQSVAEDVSEFAENNVLLFFLFKPLPVRTDVLSNRPLQHSCDLGA
jgi:hypothetical protein